MNSMQVSNADRVVFPTYGYTKGDVVDYYAGAAAAMLPCLADRPLTLQRFPKGLAGSGFMQKNTPAHYPATIERFSVSKRGGGTTEYPVIHDWASIPYLANQGTLTFHMWASTATSPDRPDFMIIDLDPEEGDVAGARFLAQMTGKLLDDFAVASAPMTTGSKGYHVWVPLAPGHIWADTERTGRAVAGILAQRHRDRATTEFLKRERAGRVFVDWLRNRSGATVVVPYSLRPRPAATVAVPLAWDELETTSPDAFTIATASDRWLNPAPLPGPQSLPCTAICDAARALGVDLDSRFDRFGRR